MNMTTTPQRILLFLAGLLIAGFGAAYYKGVFDRPAPQEATVTKPATATSVVPAVTEPAPAPAEEAGTAEAASEETAAQETAAADSNVAGDQATAAADETPVVVPSFDLLRVEPDGSLVIAGQAAPDSTVEIVAGSTVLATAKTGANGDFASVLDRALKPGDHTVVLRSTSSDKVSATSLETAIISVPSSKEGEVVALVQQPGQPSRLISVSETKAQEQAKAEELPAATEENVAAGSTESGSSEQAAEAPAADASEPAAPREEMSAKAEEPAPAATENAAGEQQQAAVQPTAPAASSAPRETQRSTASPFIEAVEIDGRQVFVAGQAAAGKRVRVYVNDVLLGQATVDTNGRFLIETERDLPVGDYIVRADVLGNDGLTVTARAAVPFARPAVESMTSIAPAPRAVPSDADVDPMKAASDGETVMGAALERADGAVIIRKGDTLWHISRRVYGRGIRYTTIYQANKDQIRDPNRIYPGQTFSLPGKTEDGEAADLDAIKDRQAN